MAKHYLVVTVGANPCINHPPQEAPDLFDPNIMDFLQPESNDRIIQVIEDIKKAIRNRPATPEEVKTQELRALREAAEFGQPPYALIVIERYVLKLNMAEMGFSQTLDF